MKRLHIPTLIKIILFVVLASQVAQAQKLRLEGQVVEATTPTRGISALGIKLTPSRDLSEPERITATDRNGHFQFSELTRGRYMFEVRQGVTLLHREIVTMESDTKIHVALRTK